VPGEPGSREMSDLTATAGTLVIRHRRVVALSLTARTVRQVTVTSAPRSAVASTRAGGFAEDGHVEIMKARLLTIITPTGHLPATSSDAISLHQTR
jgi:hypothetical protein